MEHRITRLLARLTVAMVAFASLASPASAASNAIAADCPRKLECHFVPAAYQQNNPNDPSDYGNYDLAQRESDGMDIRFAILHDTETSYDTAISIFQNSHNYVSAHYVIRSRDGEITQMVENKNVAWQAGNWNFNMHSIGIEHEGVAIQGSAWYTEDMYEASAALVRYLAAKYAIPLDRAHIIGHDDVPGPSTSFVAGMHWDPGPFWDWSRYMALLGAPLRATATGGRIVTIAPDFATNLQSVSDCQGTGATLAPQPANFVYLYTAPNFTERFNDPGLNKGGTDCANDWGDKAVAGQQFVRAGRQGSWTAIYYAGRVAWFYDPQNAIALPTAATLITPKGGKDSIPVYGRAYPESISTATLTQYTLPAGQAYVAYEKVNGDYYQATNFDDLAHYRLRTTGTQFYLIRFNHRLAYVRASDVDVLTQ